MEKLRQSKKVWIDGHLFPTDSQEMWVLKYTKNGFVLFDVYDEGVLFIESRKKLPAVYFGME